MIYNISTNRLELIQLKRKDGKRQYWINRISKEVFNEITKCILNALEVKL